MYSTSNTSSQRHIKNACSSMKKHLKKDYIRNCLKARNNTSEASREKFTHKEVKFDYQLEDYLRTIRNPAHRKVWQNCVWGFIACECENRGAPIPVEGRTCLVCNRAYIEDEWHFLMYCSGYDHVGNELHSLLSTHDVVFRNLNDEDNIRYLLTPENEPTSNSK